MAGKESETFNFKQSSQGDSFPVSSHPIDDNFISGLVKFIFKSALFIMILVWFQYGNQNLESIMNPLDILEEATTTSPVYKVPSIYHQISVLSVYFPKPKNCTGSDGDPVRLNPESKTLTRILESNVNKEVEDALIHPGDYTPNSSLHIQREAVNQNSGTFSLTKNTPVIVDENTAFSSIVYNGARSSIPGDKNKEEIKDVKPIIAIKTLPLTTTIETIETIEKFELNITPIEVSSLAARMDEKPIISDNALTTKQTNQSYNLKVDESKAEAFVSLTDELTLEPDITSSEFWELKERAALENKMLMVRFTASWCIPCKMMEENVYKNDLVKEYMEEHFFSMRLDSDSFDGINLKQLFQVKQIPSVLFFKSNGELTDHFVKSMTSSAMMQILKEQKSKNNVVNDSSLTKSENEQQVLETYKTPIAK